MINTHSTFIKILMIDSNSNDSLFLKEVFTNSEEYIEVKEVNGYSEAMAFLRRNGEYAYKIVYKPDFIFIGVDSLNRDSCKIVSELKDDPNLGNIPLMFISAFTKRKDVSMFISKRSYSLNPISEDEPFLYKNFM